LTSTERMLADPHWFPHHLDLAADELLLYPTTRERLAAEPFIDGRSDFSTGEGRRIGLAGATVAAPDSPGPDRMIFHVGFCGSTLLATVLDRPGSCFVAREPNLLAELASAPSAGADIAAPLALARRLLRRRWAEGEIVACKPSNWVNNLLPELLADPASIRPVFITMEPRAFLLAAFRGGRERLAFLIQLAAHLATTAPGGAAMWQAGSVDTADPLDRAARLVLVAHALQNRLFAAGGPWGEGHRIDFADLQRDLLGAAVKAAHALDLPLSENEIGEAVNTAQGRHAKQRGLSYSAERRAAQDEEVERHHGARIDAALKWGRSALPA
jgi:hypothetical protein